MSNAFSPYILPYVHSLTTFQNTRKYPHSTGCLNGFEVAIGALHYLNSELIVVPDHCAYLYAYLYTETIIVSIGTPIFMFVFTSITMLPLCLYVLLYVMCMFCLSSYQVFCVSAYQYFRLSLHISLCLSLHISLCLS